MRNSKGHRTVLVDVDAAWELGQKLVKVISEHGGPEDFREIELALVFTLQAFTATVRDLGFVWLNEEQ